MKELQPGIYQHAKGNLYEVLGIAHHSETLEELVLYKQLYDAPDFPRGTLWVRPKEMFLEMVEKDGILVPRFKYLREAE